MLHPHSIRLAVIAMLAGVSPLTALAQQTQSSSPPQPQRVEVTGTNIKRTDLESASPITVITREELQRSGANTLGEVITKLTVAQGGLSGVEFSGFTPGAATISLRGLGGGATLILINGRRIAPYGITGFQEIITSVNSIPVDAIDRIDILKDGASAIYGSEAIAGVVNIILRGDYNGLMAQAQHSFNEGGSLKIYRAGLSGGIGDITKDRYNVFGVFEHLEQKPSKVSDNNFFPSRNLVGLTGLANQDFRSSYSYPGNVAGPTRILPGTTCEPQNTRVVNGVARCVLDVFEYNTLLPKATRDSLLTRGTLQLTADIQAFAELGFSKSDYRYQFDPQFYFNDDATGLLNMSGAAYGLPGTIGVIYRAGDLGPRGYKVLSDEGRALVGLKGSLGSWDFDSAIGTMINKVRVDQTGSILISEMEPALANGTYVPGLPNAADVKARISPTLTREGKATTTFIDARVGTSFGAMPGGPIGFAAGVEARRERQKDAFDERFVTGDVFGFGALEPIDANRNVKSAYAEFSLPLLKTLEAQLAARYDNYSIGGNSTTPKIGLKWTALPNLVLRGTFARGFRAANARETNTATSVGFFNGVQDPIRCPVIDPLNPDCSLSIQANISGNPNLDPEKSKSFTAGLVLELAKDISISADVWKIERTNEITNLDINFLLGNQGQYTSFIRRDVNGSITDVDLPYVNLAGTTVQGLDVDLRGRQNMGEAGTFTFGVAATYYHKFLIQPAPGAPVENYNGTYSQPRFRATARAGVESGPWTTEFSWTHVGAYLNQPTPSSVCSAPAALIQYCTIDAWNNFGLFIGYKGFKNLDLRLTIDNLVDAAPPFDYRAAVNSQTRAWSPIYHHAFGRTYSLGLNYKFF